MAVVVEFSEPNRSANDFKVLIDSDDFKVGVCFTACSI